MRLFYILLFIPLGLSAQYYVTDGAGNRVFLNGDAVKSVGVATYPDTEPAKNIIWQNDFESNTVGSYDTIEMNNDFDLGGDIVSVSSGKSPNPVDDLYVGRTQVIEFNGGKALKTIIPAFSNNDGTQFIPELSEENRDTSMYHEIELTYKPGGWSDLTNKSPGTGGKGLDSLVDTYAAGSNDYVDLVVYGVYALPDSISSVAGWSARPTPNDGTVADGDGFSIYIYPKRRTNLYGNPAPFGREMWLVTDVDDSQTTYCDPCDGTPTPLAAVRWDWWDASASDTVRLKLITWVVLNTVTVDGNPTADGRLEVWAQRESDPYPILRFRRTNIVWRHYNAIKTDAIMWGCFGSSNTSYPTREEWIIVDNEALYTIPSFVGPSPNDRTITPVYPF